MKTKLPNGATYGHDKDGNKICTGSQYGRRSWRGQTPAMIDVQFRKLKWVDRCYDEGGAYWGYVPGTSIYWANFDLYDQEDKEIRNHDIFVRASSIDEARQKVREQIPYAKFTA